MKNTAITYSVCQVDGKLELTEQSEGMLLVRKGKKMERKRTRKSEFVERFPELSLFYRLFSPLNSEMICIFPYFCPYAESAREIREIFS